MDFQAILLLYIKMGLYYSIKLDLLAITPISNKQMIHIKNKKHGSSWSIYNGEA